MGAAADRPRGTGPPLPFQREGVIDRLGMETCDGPGLFANPPTNGRQRSSPRPSPPHREGVTDHADATSTLGGHLELAHVSVVRPLLGARMRPAHRPPLPLGALHLRAHAYGHRHHRQGARANRRLRSRGSQRSGRLKANYGEVAGQEAGLGHGWLAEESPVPLLWQGVRTWTQPSGFLVKPSSYSWR